MDKIISAFGQKPDNAPATEARGAGATGEEQKLPKGVVIGKDGKPCRTCTSVSNWMKLAKAESKGSSSSSSSASSTAATTGAGAALASSASSLSPDPYPSDCPPDVERLGNHTWTLLHSISATYPERASPQQASDMKQFLTLFGKLYPCWVCADDFQTWMAKRGNEPRVEGREGLGRWMCEAHNEVNRKLGKDEFDCAKWKERWRDGWKDGSCD